MIKRCILLMSFLVSPLSAQELPKKLVQFIQETLPTIEMPKLTEAVVAQNTLKLPLQKIQAIDQEWKSTNGITRFMLDLMVNEAALELWNVQMKYPFIVESSAVDKQGALVAITHKTTHKMEDYWQGGQKFFIRVSQSGTVYSSNAIATLGLDEVLVKAAVPLKSADTLIGTIAFEINLDYWETR